MCYDVRQRGGIMPKLKQVAARISPEMRLQIEYLKKVWGTLVPLSDSDVIRVAIQRAVEVERKSRKKSSDGA
jgi:hypothetical protein